MKEALSIFGCYDRIWYIKFDVAMFMIIDVNSVLGRMNEISHLSV